MITMSNNVQRYCEICGREYNNIHQHYKTKKHQNAMASAEKSNDDNTDSRENIITPEKINDVEVQENEEIEEIEKTTTGTIQIIDSNTGKKQPSGLDRFLEIAFSEQFAPITLSIMDGIAKRLSGSANNEVEEGNLVKTVSGAVIRVPNKEF